MFKMSTRNSKPKQGAKGKPKPKTKQPPRQSRQRWTEEALISRVPAHVIKGNRMSTDRKSCEQDFIAARIDPLRYNGRLPCHIGATAASTISDRSKARLTMTIGTNGTGWVAFNPYRSPAIDASDVAVTTSTWATSDITFNAAGVAQSASRGGLFSLEQLRVVDQGKSPSARIIAAGLRLTPTSPVTKISGSVYPYQVPEQPDFAGLYGLLNLEPVNVINDYSKDVVVLNADQRCLEYIWTPPGEIADQWLDSAVFADNGGEQKYTDVLYIQGAEPGATFLCEYVCYYEYRAPTLASMSRPTHRNVQLAAQVNEFTAKHTVSVSQQNSTGWYGMLEQGGKAAYSLLKDIGVEAVGAYMGGPTVPVARAIKNSLKIEEVD